MAKTHVWTGRLEKLRRSDPDIDAIMTAYEEAASIYGDALVAIGRRTSRPVAESASTDVPLEMDASPRQASLSANLT